MNKVPRPTASMKGAAPLAGRITMPSERNTAAFLLVAALAVPGSDVTIGDVPLTEGLIGLIRTLNEMGGYIDLKNPRMSGGTKVADLNVRHSELRGVLVTAERSRTMLDEVPVLAIAAAFAVGRTEILGLSKLRNRTTDQLRALTRGLQANEVESHEGRDLIYIEGWRRVRGGASVETGGDANIAMCFLVLGMGSDEAVIIDDVGAITAVFPDFLADFSRLGSEFQTLDMVL